MFLIVGLGNPGLAYSYTRHNAGFMFADFLQHELCFPDFRSNFKSLFSEKSLQYGPETAKVIIQKPQTYMNLSGQAVLQIASFYKIKPQDTFVIHDDIDLKPFEIKIKNGGGNGGHNGLRNIDSQIGKDYWRIRIGVGRPLDKAQVSDYVLSTFFRDEITILQNEMFPKIVKHMGRLLFETDKSRVISDILAEFR